jgi:hypothetical protein
MRVTSENGSSLNQELKVSDSVTVGNNKLGQGEIFPAVLPSFGSTGVMENIGGLHNLREKWPGYRAKSAAGHNEY